MKNFSDYALSQNGTAVVEELPSWHAFFTKYILAAESVSLLVLASRFANCMLPKNIGFPRILGTRLIPAANFECEQGLEAVYNVLVGMLPISSPNIILGTPYLYKYKEGSTSVTPAWRNSIWHACHNLACWYASIVHSP